MGTTPRDTMDTVRDKLTELLNADVYGITNLTQLRVLVNQNIAQVEGLEVVPSSYGTPQLGFLEILNYLLGATQNPVVAVQGTDDTIVGFVRAEDVVDCSQLDAAGNVIPKRVDNV